MFDQRLIGMNKGPEKEKSIGEIIRGMVADGESFEAIVRTLQGLGIPKEQAEILVNLYKVRVSPEINSRVGKKLEKKFSSAEEAAKRKPIHREASLQRRRHFALSRIQNEISRIPFSSSAKSRLVQTIADDYFSLLEKEIEVKKELNRALLEALDDENLPRRSSAKIRNAIRDLKEL
jgi:hypothetical protein